jgi:hypothetical protein
LLQAGVISPYFIWPNINPFREKGSLVNAVIEPKKAKDEAQRATLLRKAREGVRRARREGRGIFSPEDPLQLEPFEIRFWRVTYQRWVIDLSKNDDILINLRSTAPSSIKKIVYISPKSTFRCSSKKAGDANDSTPYCRR